MSEVFASMPKDQEHPSDVARDRRAVAQQQVTITDWLTAQHPGPAQPAVRVAVLDRTGIWSGRLLAHVQQLDPAARSRTVQMPVGLADGGPGLQLDHVSVSDGTSDGPALDLYSGLHRATSEQRPLVYALAAACDYILCLVGPMRDESLDRMTSHLHQVLRAPGCQTRRVFFALSGAAPRQAQGLVALAQAFPARIDLQVVNLAETESLWKAALGSFETSESGGLLHSRSGRSTDPAQDLESQVHAILHDLGSRSGALVCALFAEDTCLASTQTSECPPARWLDWMSWQSRLLLELPGGEALDTFSASTPAFTCCGSGLWLDGKRLLLLAAFDSEGTTARHAIESTARSMEEISATWTHALDLTRQSR